MRGKLRTVKNAVVHVVLLAVIFLAAVVLFERWINESLPLEAEEMEAQHFLLSIFTTMAQITTACTVMRQRWMSIISVIR